MRKEPPDQGKRENRLPPRLESRAEAAVDITVRAGAIAYERGRDLPGLIRMDPRAARTETPADAEQIVARLERALRAERTKARSGHWTYDLNRHIALRQAHLAERRRLAALKAERR